MTHLPPIALRYEGSGEFKGSVRVGMLCDQHLVIGHLYELEIVEGRSSESHRHYFATIAQAWANLPEHLADQFPTSEHLRKWALIKAGWCDQDQIVVDDADVLASLIPFLRRRDEYSIVDVSENVVTVYTARSQAGRSQNKQQFQATKDRVFQILAELIGTDPASLSRAEAA